MTSKTREEVIETLAAVGDKNIQSMVFTTYAKDCGVASFRDLMQLSQDVSKAMTVRKNAAAERKTAASTKTTIRISRPHSAYDAPRASRNGPRQYGTMQIWDD